MSAGNGCSPVGHVNIAGDCATREGCSSIGIYVAVDGTIGDLHIICRDTAGELRIIRDNGTVVHNYVCIHSTAIEIGTLTNDDFTHDIGTLCLNIVSHDIAGHHGTNDSGHTIFAGHRHICTD